VSIYDPAAVGPLRLSPVSINGDYVQTDVAVAVDGADCPSAPYISDNALYIPVKVWERVQDAAQ
jgi:hypothetical protein